MITKDPIDNALCVGHCNGGHLSTAVSLEAFISFVV